MNSPFSQPETASLPAAWGLLFLDCSLLRLDIKSRCYIPEFSNANLWSLHLIAFNIDWSFTSHDFFSMLIEQLINLENLKVRTENLKFWAGQLDRVMLLTYAWWVSNPVDDCLQRQIVLSTLVTTLLFNIAFYLLLIWLQTLVAIES